MSSRLNNISGIILRKRIFMESDLILTVLSDKGLRYDLIVKGAGNGKSKRNNHLELMNSISGTIYSGKTQTYLQTVQCQSSYSHLKDNLEYILRMQVILEIIEKTVLENDAHPEIYTILHQSLKDLNSKEPNPFTPEITLIKLAHFLGFLPSFKLCGNCNNSLEEDNAHWNQEAGTLHCRSCSKEHHTHLPLKYRKALEFFRIAQPEQSKKVILRQEEHSKIQAFLPKLFTNHLNKPLKSLAVL